MQWLLWKQKKLYACFASLISFCDAGTTSCAACSKRVASSPVRTGVSLIGFAIISFTLILCKYSSNRESYKISEIK